jgi:hypothetical protein
VLSPTPKARCPVASLPKSNRFATAYQHRLWILGLTFIRRIVHNNDMTEPFMFLTERGIFVSDNRGFPTIQGVRPPAAACSGGTA